MEIWRRREKKTYLNEENWLLSGRFDKEKEDEPVKCQRLLSFAPGMDNRKQESRFVT